MKLIVGIDFGTSTTVVRYREEGTNVIQSLKAENGKSEIIPTIIFRPKDGGCTVYGEQALLKIDNMIEGETVMNFKMNLLNPELKNEAKANIIEFLTYIHTLFEDQTKALHPDFMDVYVSYPAKWSDDMVTFMKQAVEKAGFAGNGVVVKGMKEPQAASLNMLHECKEQLKNNGILKPGKPLRVLMLDMGAGTSDISIFKLDIDGEGKTKIGELLSYPSISEPILCGGREIDATLQRYFIDMGKSKGVNIMPECVAPQIIKRWKESTLSPFLKDGTKVVMPSNLIMLLKMMGRADIVNSFSMERDDFEHLTKSHWKKLYQLVRSAFAQYKFAKPEDIDIVFLTGGHSNWYAVPKLFNGEGLIGGLAKVGKDPEALNFKKIIAEPGLRMTDLCNNLPHETVARGMCLNDETVDFDMRSSNNVWGQIQIGSSKSDFKELVSKNSVLPNTQHMEFVVTEERNALFSNLEFNAGVCIYTGETQENAILQCYSFKYDDGDLMGRIIALLLIFPALMKLPYTVKVSMDITITEEGSLKVDGTVDFDSSKTVTFTEKDLVIKSNED